MLDGTNLYLIGMMGAGKTTVGKLLAQQLGYKFFDTDTLIEDCTKHTVSEIFASAGEAAFRKVERDVLAQISAYTGLVVATGGGIVLNNLNWSHLRDGIIVWLDVPTDELYRRLAECGDRPLLQTDNPKATLTDIYTQRRDRYAEADIHLGIQGSETPESVCDRLLVILKETIEPNRLKFKE